MFSNQRVIATLAGCVPDKVPVICTTQIGIKDCMAAVNVHFPDAHNDAEKMAKLGSALIELAGLENARIPFCVTVLAEVFGCEINFGTDEISPSIKKHLLSVDKLEIPDNFLNRGRIPIVRNAAEILRSTIGDKTPMIVGVEGPFTLAGHLIGVEKLMGWCIINPKKIEEILEVTTEAIIKYANHILKAGSDIMCISDPLASLDLISPTHFRDFVKPCLKEIAENVGGINIIHICGDVTNILADMAECGFDGLSIEEGVDIEKARSIVGENVVLIGNISTKQTLAFGKPEQVKNDAINALKAGVDVLAPGCGLSPLTPLNNIVAMVQTAEEWNQPRRKMASNTEILTPETAKELGYELGEALVKLVQDK